MRKERTNKERIEKFDIIVGRDFFESPELLLFSSKDYPPAYLVLNILDETVAGSRNMVLMNIGSANNIVSSVVDACFVERHLSFPARREVFDSRMVIISELNIDSYDYASLVIDSYVRELVGLDPVSTTMFKQSVLLPQSKSKDKEPAKNHSGFRIDLYDEILAKLCGMSTDPCPDPDESIMDILCNKLDIHSSKYTGTEYSIFDMDHPLKNLGLEIPDWLKGGEDLMKDGEISMIIGSTISAKDFLTAYQTFSDEEVMEMYGIESKNELKEIVSSLVKRYKLK